MVKEESPSWAYEPKKDQTNVHFTLLQNRFSFYPPLYPPPNKKNKKKYFQLMSANIQIYISYLFSHQAL